MQGEIRLVDHVAQAFAALVTTVAPRSIMLSGGDTARSCYELLAVADVAWREVDVTLGDERWVPVSDPDSNEGMARHAFLDSVLPRAVHSMYAAGETIAAGADRYGRLLAGFGPVDLVHLGLGPDGHTCSLFPGSPALEVKDRLVVVSIDDEHPHPRLTVTYPYLETCPLVVFTVEGADKREPVARLRAGEDLPAGRVRAEKVVWLIDAAANGS